MCDVTPNRILLNLADSSTAAYISRTLAPCGPRMDGALPGTMSFPFEDKNGCREVRFVELAIPAPTGFES